MTISSNRTKQVLVLIVIVNCNQKIVTLSCLDSLRKSKYHNYTVLLIDNHSTDGSIEEIRKRFPDFKISVNKENLGASTARNIGIDYFLHKTSADYLFFLDNDTEVDEGLLGELIAAGESSLDTGIVCMKAYYFNQRDMFWVAGGGKINWMKGDFYNLGQREIDKGQYDNGKDIDSVPGGFSFVKRKLVEKIGNFDERYFLYFEDTDWCIRAKKVGYKIVLASRARIWHKASSSLGAESPLFYYYRTRNRLLFMFKNAPRLFFLIFFFYFVYDYFCNTLITLYLSKKPRQLRASIIGVLDFMKSKYGQKSLSDEILDGPLYKFLF